ncbi:MAG: DUF4250 domain-containing protein [Roseburia sp.]
MIYDSLPSDPVMLLSFLNTQLRDNYKSLDALCMAFDLEPDTILKKMSMIDYEYDSSANQFI